MSDRADLARGWFRKGDSDLVTARLVASGAGPYDTACFHAQQAAEKYLKAFCHSPVSHFHWHTTWKNWSGAVLLSARHLNLTGCDLTQLTPYAVQLRYDSSFWPDQTTAQEAIDLAEQVRAAVLTIVPSTTHP